MLHRFAPKTVSRDFANCKYPGSLNAPFLGADRSFFTSPPLEAPLFPLCKGDCKGDSPFWGYLPLEAPLFPPCKGDCKGDSPFWGYLPLESPLFPPCRGDCKGTKAQKKPIDLINFSRENNTLRRMCRQSNISGQH